MTAVLLYPLLASPIKNHTPSAIFSGEDSCPEPHRTRQSSSNQKNNLCRPPRRTGPDTKPPRPRGCVASVISFDETLAIAATLRSAGARSPPATTTSTARPSLSARTIRTRSTSSSRDYRHSIGTVEVRLVRRLVPIIIKILPVLIDLIGRLVRNRCRTGFNATPVGPDLARLRQAQLRALFPQNRLPRKLDAVAFNRQDLHQNLVALAQLIFDLLHAMLCDLGDVQQTIGPREYLDKCAELSEPHDFA